MNKQGFCFGIVGGSRKRAFEKDSGIRISFVTDGTFVLRLQSGSKKPVEENIKTIEGLCSMIKSLLTDSSDKINETVTLNKRLISEDEYNKKMSKLSELRERRKKT